MSQVEMVYTQFGMSVNVTCSLPSTSEAQTYAPFWFINETAYELLSIPRNFPFIPTVKSYLSLTIPHIDLDVNMTLFQCATFNGSGFEFGTSQLILVNSSLGMLLTTSFSLQKNPIKHLSPYCVFGY